MFRLLKIWWFKRKARACYIKWRNVNADLDCGDHMSAIIRPLAMQHAENQALFFDIYVDKLRALGVKVPDKRLSNHYGPPKQ